MDYEVDEYIESWETHPFYSLALRPYSYLQWKIYYTPILDPDKKYYYYFDHWKGGENIDACVASGYELNICLTRVVNNQLYKSVAVAEKV